MTWAQGACKISPKGFCHSPTAGLQQAYRWMKTDDPHLLLAATATFNDIPGHKEEAMAASAAYDRALCKRHPAMAMCHNLPKQ